MDGPTHGTLPALVAPVEKSVLALGLDQMAVEEGEEEEEQEEEEREETAVTVGICSMCAPPAEHRTSR